VLAETIHEAHTLLHRAVASPSEGEQAEFLSFTQAATQRFPKDPELRLMHATALMSVRPDEVAWQAATAVSLAVDDPGYLTRAARLLLYCGEIKAAEAYVERASELAPPDFLFADELADLNLRLSGLHADEEFR